MTDPILPIKEFSLRVYGGRGPCLETLKKRIREGQIPGGHIEGGRYMVDMAKYNQERFKNLDDDDIDPAVRRAVGL